MLSKVIVILILSAIIVALISLTSSRPHGNINVWIADQIVGVGQEVPVEVSFENLASYHNVRLRIEVEPACGFSLTSQQFITTNYGGVWIAEHELLSRKLGPAYLTLIFQDSGTYTLKVDAYLDDEFVNNTTREILVNPPTTPTPSLSPASTPSPTPTPTGFEFFVVLFILTIIYIIKKRRNRK